MFALADVVAVLQGAWPGRFPARDRALLALAVCTGEPLAAVLGLCCGDFYCQGAGYDAPFDLQMPHRKFFKLDPGVQGMIRAAVNELEQRGCPCGVNAPVLQTRPGHALSVSRARRILAEALRRAGLPSRGVPGQLRAIFQEARTRRKVSRDAVAQAESDHAVGNLNLGMPE